MGYQTLPDGTVVFDPNVERWRPLVEKYFGPLTNIALFVMDGESSGNPTAQNQNSSATGLFQFIRGTWTGGVNLFGIGEAITDRSAADGRFDPEANIAMAAAYVAKDGWDHWEVYNNHTAEALKFAPQGYVGHLGFDKQPTLSADSLRSGALPDLSGDDVFKQFSQDVSFGWVPADGQMYEVQGLGNFVLYKLSANAISSNLAGLIPEADLASPLQGWISFKLNPATLHRIKNLDELERSSRTLSPADYYRLFPNAVNGGDLAEAADPDKRWATLGDWYQDQVVRLYPDLGDAVDDPEIESILNRAVLEGWTPQELENALTRTDYWQTRTAVARDWDLLNEVERQQAIESEALRLQAIYQSLFGINLPFNDPSIAQAAEAIARGQLTVASVTDLWRSRAAGDPNSPFAQDLLERFKRPIQIEDTRLQLRALARDWGIELSEDRLGRWATEIVDFQSSTEDFIGLLKGQAENVFGSREAGNSTRGRDVPVADWAVPWLDSYADLMEVQSDIDLVFDPFVRDALVRNLSVADFRTEVRSRPEWLDTDNARQKFAETISGIGSMFGYG